MRTSAHLIMRRRQVVDELCFIYPISRQIFTSGASTATTQVFTPGVCQLKEKACINAFQVANVHLPDAENLLGIFYYNI